MSTLLGLGVLQGWIMGIGLWVYARTRNGTHYLALAILAFSLTLLRLWSFYSGLWDHPLFRRFPLAFDLAILPLFYLYALAFTGASARVIRRQSLWLLPWAVFMLYSVAVYVASLGEPTLALRDELARRWWFGEVKTVEDYLTIVLNTVLGVMTWLRTNRYYRRTRNWLPEHQSAWVGHLRILLLLLLVAMVMNIIGFVANHLLAQTDMGLLQQSVYIFYVVLVYVVGFVGYRVADLPRFPGAGEEPASAAAVTPEDLRPALARLQALMTEEALYTNPDLNLNDLANQLQLSAAQTTQLIKTATGNNFRSFVNEFRIADVKRKLKDPAYAECSILALALESGFNSESSFYRVFKAATGISPTQYRQRAD